MEDRQCLRKDAKMPGGGVQAPSQARSWPLGLLLAGPRCVSTAPTRRFDKCNQDKASGPSPSPTYPQSPSLQCSVLHLVVFGCSCSSDRKGFREGLVPKQTLLNQEISLAEHSSWK